MSLSADSWIDNKRVLDVSRDAILTLGEVATALGDPLQIHGFASNTRNHCRVWTVKSWGEPWSVGRGRLGALVPQGYTRIGPAVRHAVSELQSVKARKRLLFVITDGKPTDFDRYEGEYGRADVRQAVREARQQGTEVHVLGIDPSAVGALPAMFGPRGWTLLRDINRLPEALVEAYGKVR